MTSPLPIKAMLLGGFIFVMAYASYVAVVSPYQVIDEIKQGMADGKPDILRQHADFEALRSSLKGEIAPEDLALMAQGSKPSSQNTQHVGYLKGDVDRFKEFKGSYKAWNQFIVNVPCQDGTGSIGFIFNRKRMMDWKLVELRLPKNWTKTPFSL